MVLDFGGRVVNLDGKISLFMYIYTPTHIYYKPFQVDNSLTPDDFSDSLTVILPFPCAVFTFFLPS